MIYDFPGELLSVDMVYETLALHNIRGVTYLTAICLRVSAAAVRTFLTITRAACVSAGDLRRAARRRSRSRARAPSTSADIAGSYRCGKMIFCRGAYTRHQNVRSPSGRSRGKAPFRRAKMLFVSSSFRARATLKTDTMADLIELSGVRTISVTAADPWRLWHIPKDNRVFAFFLPPRRTMKMTNSRTFLSTSTTDSSP